MDSNNYEHEQPGWMLAVAVDLLKADEVGFGFRNLLNYLRGPSLPCKHILWHLHALEHFEETADTLIEYQPLF